MKEDDFYIWWVNHRLSEFCQYMKSYAMGWHGNTPENHKDETVLLDSAITFFDQRNKSFIGQLLCTKYGVDFVRSVAHLYLDREWGVKL